MNRFIIIFCLFSVSCETVVDVELPSDGRFIVVNSLINPDSIFHADLSFSNHVLNEDPFVEMGDAEVIVSDGNGNPIDKLLFNPGTGDYVGSTKPKLDQPYYLKVTINSQPEIKANCKIPYSVIITNVTIDSLNIDHDGLIPMSIHFKDPVNTRNFFQFQIQQKSYWVDYITKDTIPYERPVFFKASDPLLEAQYLSTGLLFDDRFFDGKEYVLSIRVSAYSNPGASTFMILNSLSEDYYLYRRTLDLQRNASGDPLSQPVIVHSNISNGLGIFGGYSSHVLAIK